ncbi:MAG: GNAT family N-acetyltransferase [Saprospiraceae bacterium]|nr:GNAT family N-acetyltransferase [Saprospiraceae bacterium]
MKIFVETERFILREIVPTDIEGLYELDSDPEVHRYLGNEPVTDKDKLSNVIQLIRQQYIDNGIGRWAVVHKKTEEFVGWSGLKLERNLINDHQNYYDLGYRIQRKYWGQGIASETAKATLNFGIEQLQLQEVFSIVHCDNLASQAVLNKLGFVKDGIFECDGEPHFWCQLNIENWLNK